MLQCSFLHCLSICKLFVVFFCTVCPYVNCLLFFCTVWSTLIRISLTKALVLWWCDNKSDLIWFDLDALKKCYLKNVFWRKLGTKHLMVDTDLHIIIYFFVHTNGGQWLSSNVWLPTFFKISSFVFLRIEKEIQPHFACYFKTTVGNELWNLCNMLQEVCVYCYIVNVNLN